MATADESELQDFLAIIAQHGYLKDDFSLTRIDDKPMYTPLYAVTGTITVPRKSTDISRQYKAGHTTAWLENFDTDLRSKVFGSA